MSNWEIAGWALCAIIGFGGMIVVERQLMRELRNREIVNRGGCICAKEHPGACQSNRVSGQGTKG